MVDNEVLPEGIEIIDTDNVVSTGVDTEVKEDGAFSHSGSNAEVEILETDYYEMLAEIGVKSETEGVTFEMRLMRDDGLGYLEVEGSRAFCKL